MSFKKGSIVYMRDDSGHIDMSRKFRLRSCGKLQAVLDEVGFEGRRGFGHTKYLTPPDTVRDYEERHRSFGEPYPYWIKTSWAQYFFLAERDWDEEKN